MDNAVPFDHPDHICDRCRRVAAVCYRHTGHGVEFLLVRTTDDRRWTFPKGHVEDGERGSQTAVREAEEEAGVIGRVNETMVARYKNHGGVLVGHPQTVETYLLEAAAGAEAGSAEPGRSPTWMQAPDALEALGEGKTEVEAESHRSALRAAIAALETV